MPWPNPPSAAAGCLAARCRFWGPSLLPGPCQEEKAHGLGARHGRGFDAAARADEAVLKQSTRWRSDRLDKATPRAWPRAWAGKCPGAGQRLLFASATGAAWPGWALTTRPGLIRGLQHLRRQGGEGVARAHHPIGGSATKQCGLPLNLGQRRPLAYLLVLGCIPASCRNIKAGEPTRARGLFRVLLQAGAFALGEGPPGLGGACGSIADFPRPL